jgi:ribosome-interacting GTPase 1
VIFYKGAKLQLLDLPGIIEGAKDGKGRGRQVIAVARTCNLILIVLDAMKPLVHKKIIEVGARAMSDDGRGESESRSSTLCDISHLLFPRQKKKRELEGFGIRLNRQPPNMYFKRKDKGGINLNHTGNYTPSHLDIDTVKVQHLFIICNVSPSSFSTFFQHRLSSILDRPF